MSNNKRTDILDAALILFAERGFAGTTVPVIAEKAKVGAGTIYRYFESKEVLGNCLFQECVQELSNTATLNAPSEAASTRERFSHIFKQMSRFACDREQALAFIDAHSNAPFLDDSSVRMFEEFLNKLRLLLDEGKSQGHICPLPSDALIAIVYGSLVKLFKVIRIGVVQQSADLLDQVEECCWNAIRVH